MVNIREILPLDERQFCRMVRKFYDSPAVLHKIPDSHAEKTFKLLQTGTPYARCFIAEDKNKIARGYCLCSITWSNEAGGICIWIDELYVDEELRGHGIGQMLIAEVAEAYPYAARFRLELVPNNARAAKLYLSLGFEHLDYDQMVLDSPK